MCIRDRYISASGEGGNSLEYIQQSADGGRIEIASICLEPIINSLLQRASLTGRVGEEIGAVETEYRQKLELMRQLVMRMSELEEDYFPMEELEIVRQEYQASSAQYTRYEAEVEYVQQGLDMVKALNKEIKSVESDLKSAQGQHAGLSLGAF